MHGNYQVNVGDLQTKRIPNKFVENNVENSYWLTWTKMLPPKKRKTPKTNSIQKRWIFPVFFSGKPPHWMRLRPKVGLDSKPQNANNAMCLSEKYGACVYTIRIYIYIIFVYFVYTLNNMPVYNQYIKEWIFFRPEYYFSSVFPQPKLFSVGPTYTTCGILWPLLWWGKYTLGASLIIRATKLRGWIVFPETFQPVIVSPVFIGEKKMPQFWKRIVFQPPIFQGQKRYVFRECRGWIIAQHLILLLWNL